MSGSEPSHVVPDQHLAVADDDRVALGAGTQRHPSGVRDLLAPAVAAPPPVVERAGDLVALDRALGEVAAHVAAVAVQDVDLALACPARRRPCRRTCRCRAACRRRSCRASPRQCQPTREPLRRRAVVESACARCASVVVIACLRSIWTKTRTGYSFCSGGASGHPEIPLPGESMHVALTPDQERLREELREYFAALVTPEVRPGLAVGLRRVRGREGLQGRHPPARHRRLARHRLAEGVRRPGPLDDRAADLHRRRRGGRRTDPLPDAQHGRADDHALRHGRAEGLLPPPHPRRATCTSRSATPSPAPAPTSPRSRPAPSTRATSG